MNSMRGWLWAVAAISLVGCKHSPDEHEKRGAEIHYDLGVSAEQEGKIQDAFREFKAAEELDDTFPEPHYAMGTLLQFSFKKLEEAAKEDRWAIELRPQFTDAKVGLGTVNLELGRYDEAGTPFSDALNA